MGKLINIRILRKELLEELYLNQGLNCREIGERLKVHRSVVWEYLKKFQISTRTSSEAKRKKIDRNELSYLYLDSKLGITEIGNKFQVSSWTIWKYLKEFQIPIRSYSEAFHLRRGNHIEINETIRSFLFGELLGDGSLFSNSKFSALFSEGSKYERYLEWISKTLRESGIQQSGQIIKRIQVDRNSTTFHYSSRRYAELKEIYDLFYPNGIKILPSLNFDPLVLRQWYLGDGSLIHPPNSVKPCIQISTDSFTEMEIDFAIEQFRDLGFFATKVRHKKFYRIRLSTDSTQKFLNYIGPYPSEIEDIYGYKFDWKKEDPNQLKLDI